MNNLEYIDAIDMNARNMEARRKQRARMAALVARMVTERVNVIQVSSGAYGDSEGWGGSQLWLVVEFVIPGTTKWQKFPLHVSDEMGNAEVIECILEIVADARGLLGEVED